MYSTQSDSYREPRAPVQRPRATARQIRAETAVSYALATFAQHARVTNKRKHHTLRERPDRLSRRVPAESALTRDVAPNRTRIDDSPVLFTESRAFNDPEFRARYDAMRLADHRAECARKRALATRK
jgi:hypothetical protein